MKTRGRAISLLSDKSEATNPSRVAANRNYATVGVTLRSPNNCKKSHRCSIRKTANRFNFSDPLARARYVVQSVLPEVCQLNSAGEILLLPYSNTCAWQFFLPVRCCFKFAMPKTSGAQKR